MSVDTDPCRSKKKIFLAALKITDPQQRREFMDQNFGDDAQRRREVEDLLAADDAGSGSPLDQVIERLGPTDLSLIHI